jgi:putative membrane protein
MAGPLPIAVAAPVTLALRALRPSARARLLGLLRAPAVRFAGHPVTAVVLSGGGLVVLYLTPLHARAHEHVGLGLLVQAHVVVAGTLAAWAIVGTDRVPHRPSLRVRGAALAALVVLHTALSRLLFADADRLAAEAGGSAAEWRGAAEIMWYEGDLLELALVITFAAQALRRGTRRSPFGAGGAGHDVAHATTASRHPTS